MREEHRGGYAGERHVRAEYAGEGLPRERHPREGHPREGYARTGIARAGLLFVLFLASCFLLFGCEEKQEETTKSEDTITLYYLNNTEDGLTEVHRSLEEKENTKKKVKEVLRLLSAVEEDNVEYKPSIYDGVIINSVKIKKNRVSIDFESNYQQLSAKKEILLRSSIVKSLIQIDDVDNVVFTVGGNNLVDSDDKVIGAMNGDSFLLKTDELYTRTEKVNLYYANKKGDGLVEVPREIKVKDNMPMETGMLNELIAVSGPEGTRNPLPRKLKILSTQVYNQICYVDLSSDILEVMPDVEERVKIYAMVDTLTNRGSASQVQFTVEGQPLAALNEVEGFDQPMSFDYNLAGKKKKSKKEKKKEKKDKNKDEDDEDGDEGEDSEV